MSIIVAVRGQHETALATGHGATRQNDQAATHENSGYVQEEIHDIEGWRIATSGSSLWNHILAARTVPPPKTDTVRSVHAAFMIAARRLTSPREDEEFRFTVLAPGNTESNPIAIDLYNSFLVVSPAGNIYHVNREASVSEHTKFAATGSGAPYALGCLYQLFFADDVDPRRFAKRAVQAAIAFDIYCHISGIAIVYVQHPIEENTPNGDPS